MKNYIAYKLTGQITKTGVCAGADFYLQGEHVIEGVANDATQYIQDGELVDMPPRPGEFYIFDYETKQWIPDASEADNAARTQRNSLLQASDWTQLPDVPLETKQAWATYRQALRDITTQEGYPFNIIWPTKPD